MEPDGDTLKEIQKEYKRGDPSWWYLMGYRYALLGMRVEKCHVETYPTYHQGYLDACGDWDIDPQEPRE